MKRTQRPPRTPSSRRIAVIGAGIAGLACARTLQRAGCDVQVFEAADEPGGRLASQDSPFGTFDTGAQYFTVRDARFTQALQATAADVVRPWSANAVRVLDEHGRVVEAALPAREAHWVAVPSMNGLAQRWAAPLQAASALHLGTQVERIAAHPAGWQVQARDASDPHRPPDGFDAVLLAVPASGARELLSKVEHLAPLAQRVEGVDVAPCWTLITAFPHAAQPTLNTLGPQWNAARSTHHRVAWLARESSKPGRTLIERWTVQASPGWSREHEGDDPARVTAKLLKAFGEITGIRATPTFAEARLWRQAQTLVPLGETFMWDAALGVGVCGDWCIGHRVEDAFVSGLELALRVIGD